MVKGDLGEKIVEEAIKILEMNSSGIKYTELARLIQKSLPGTNLKTIFSNIWNLQNTAPSKVLKPAKGLFLHIKYAGTSAPSPPSVSATTSKIIPEDDFYEPFAIHIVGDLEDATKAMVLGHDYLKGKWGTPDVIGIRKSDPTDIFTPDMEIISAEIKTNTKELVTAFGQACSYRLFSHRSYIVVPKQSLKMEISKLEALCEIFGIGLILFNKDDPSNPEFEIRARAMKGEPDWFYANEVLKKEKIKKALID